MLCDFNTLTFEEYLLLGKYIAFFTSSRVNRDTVPEGLYTYDLREESGDVCQLSEFILINHYGTVISTEPIEELQSERFVSINEETDFQYIYHTVTPETIKYIKKNSAFSNIESFIKWLNMKMKNDSLYEVDDENVKPYLNNLLFQHINLSQIIKKNVCVFLLPWFSTRSRKDEFYSYSIENGIIKL